MSTITRKPSAIPFSKLTWAIRFSFLSAALAPGLMLGLFILLDALLSPALSPSKLLTETASYLQSLGAPSTTGNVNAEKCISVASPKAADDEQMALPSIACSEWKTVELTQEEFSTLIRKAAAACYLLILIPTAIFVLGSGLANRRKTAVPVRADGLPWESPERDIQTQASGDNHLTGQDSFDYSKAKADYFGFYYSSDDTQQLRRAAGKPDWVPLAVAMASLNSTRQGFYVLDSLLDAYDLPQDALAAADWLSANEQSFWVARKALERQYDAYRSTAIDGRAIAARGYTGLSPVEAAHEFCQAYQMSHPRRTIFFLCASEERIAYLESSVVKSARQSAEALFASAVAWTADLFEESGLEVDRENNLVLLPGYQPLYLATSDEI